VADSREFPGILPGNSRTGILGGLACTVSWSPMLIAIYSEMLHRARYCHGKLSVSVCLSVRPRAACGVEVSWLHVWLECFENNFTVCSAYNLVDGMGRQSRHAMMHRARIYYWGLNTSGFSVKIARIVAHPAHPTKCFQIGLPLPGDHCLGPLPQWPEPL